MNNINTESKKDCLFVVLLSVCLYLLQYIIFPLILDVESFMNVVFVVSSLVYLAIVLIRNIKYSDLLLEFVCYAILVYIYVVPFSYGIGYSMVYSFSGGPLIYDSFWAFLQKSVILFAYFLVLNVGVFAKKLIIRIYKKIKKIDEVQEEKSKSETVRVVFGFYFFLYLIAYVLMPIIYPSILRSGLEDFIVFIIVSISASLTVYNIKGISFKAWLTGLLFFLILSPIWTFTTYEGGMIKPPFLDLISFEPGKILLLNSYGCLISAITIISAKFLAFKKRK